MADEFPKRALAPTLREARQRLGLSQLELAGRLGVTRSLVADWEDAEAVPDPDAIRNLAAVLQLDPEALSSQRTLALFAALIRARNKIEPPQDPKREGTKSGGVAPTQQGAGKPPTKSTTAAPPRLSGTAAEKAIQSTTKPVVFIVHGHDEALKEQVARVVERISDARVVILHEQADGGKTVIEKFEMHASGARFAIVLLTPDDEVAHGADRRARQNVILELGYFLGKIGRSKVCALYKGPLELPSDIAGVLYKQVDSGGGWRLELGRELSEAGISVDLNRLYA
jgi:predicted nucleotide-binding protein/DNA-binding XRE family transcriptional regulator